MKIIGFTRSVAVLGFVGALSVTPAAAQAPAGTMTPLPSGGAAGIADSKTGGHLAKSLEFGSVATAAAHCPTDTVVWSTLSRSHSFHLSGSRYYGKTKRGAYVCKADALAAGFHQAKS